MHGMLLTLFLTTPAQVPAQQSVRPEGQPAQTDLVLLWNATALEAIRRDKTPPPLAARNLAIVHAAIYDAVNSLQRTHQRYYVQSDTPGNAVPEVAAAIAAHRALVALYPRQVDLFDATLDQSLHGLPAELPKSDGVRLGQYVAETILAWREKDGAASSTSYTPRRGPGLWEPTPPDFRQALLPQWPSLNCFCMRIAAQYRPDAPPALGSPAYESAFRAVKELGGTDSRVRTRDQTEIAWFWADDAGTATPPGHWNQVAQVAARARGNKLTENARLFALLNLALADAGVLCWDAKYHYNYWRPIQAIRADAQNGDPEWTPLLTTPPFPAYSSGHSTFSGAAAAVLAEFFGSDAFRFTVGSDGLPGVYRSFNSFAAAADEAGRSRIYGGIHWDFDNTAGLATGQALGQSVSRSFLTPIVQLSAGEGPRFATAQRRR